MLGDSGDAPDGAPGLPEPASAIILAFDSGEYERGPEDGDPVEKNTRPELRRLMGDA